MILSKNKLSSILIILSLVLGSNLALAQEVTLQQGIKLGLKNNIEIINNKNNVKQLQRNLMKIKTASDWQVNTNAETELNNFTDNLSATTTVQDTSQQLDLSVIGSKTYWSGLTLENGLYFQEDDLAEGAGDDTLNFKVSAKQDIYPSLPVEAEQNYIKTELELQKTKEELEEVKNSKIISWMEEYLKLLRLKERYELATEREKLAQQELAEVLARQKVNEAGEVDILRAKATSKEAEYNLKNYKQNYQQAKKSLAIELGLNDEDKLVITENSTYLTQLRKRVDAFAIKLDNQAKLVELAMADNLELVKNKLGQQSIEYDLKWSQLKDKPTVDLTGSYNTTNQEWSAGVSLSYNIFDSGKQEVEIENLIEELNTYQQEYQKLIKDLKIRIAKSVTQIEAQQSNLDAKELSLEKVSLEKEIANKQLKRGLIDQNEFNKKKLDLQEAKINWQQVKDKLLVSKLELLDYVGIDF